MAEPFSLRRLEADPDGDKATWLTIRQLCCRTGNGGDPIAAERWPLFAEIWVAPYQRIIPEWSYVAMAHGRVLGYLTGCPDSASFSRQRLLRCTLPLLGQIAFGQFRGDGYGRRFVRQALWLESSAERGFPRSLRLRLGQQFPAHLHMNVEADQRSGGIGSRLIERFVDDLRQRQVTGVHLLCGARPLPFYRRAGFHQLAVTAVRGANVYAMGLTL